MENDRIYRYAPLWGKWFIELPLGKGSFGSVYKIAREEMGHKYESAVKIITVPSEEQYKEAEATLGSDEPTLSHYFEDVVRNIVNEVNVLYSLGGNTNIIGYQDHQVVKHESDIGWDILIRMEYVTSLRKYLKEHQMTREEVIRLGIDLCTALEVCSRKGIVHRDIKDDNIFVNEDGVFKLGDFGIARELSGSGRAASMRGTPLYMAPEVYRGDKYDAAVDIYSLGIVLYKLLNNGRMPFMPPYPQQIRYRESEEALEKRMSGEPLPDPVRANVALSAIIRKACAHDAKDRFSTPSLMKQALEKALVEMTDKERSEQVTADVDRKQEMRSGAPENSSNTPKGDEQDRNTETISIFGADSNKVSEEQAATVSIFASSENKEQSTDNITYLKPLQSQDQLTTATKEKPKRKGRVVLWVGIAALILAISNVVTFFLSNNSILLASSKGSKSTNGETIIIFEDKGLEAAIRSKLGRKEGAIYPSELQQIIELDASYNGIKSLNDLKWLPNLKELNINTNYIEDISPLKRLKGLTVLDASNNPIFDLSPLDDLYYLYRLNIAGNHISDISPLENLTSMTSLTFAENSVEDISFLANLTHLQMLNMQGNEVKDISVLRKLVNLKQLYIGRNAIDDISALKNLVELEYLNIGSNPINDYSPLEYLGDTNIIR